MMGNGCEQNRTPETPYELLHPETAPCTLQFCSDGDYIHVLASCIDGPPLLTSYQHGKVVMCVQPLHNFMGIQKKNNKIFLSYLFHNPEDTTFFIYYMRNKNIKLLTTYQDYKKPPCCGTVHIECSYIKYKSTLREVELQQGDKIMNCSIDSVSLYEGNLTLFSNNIFYSSDIHPSISKNLLNAIVFEKDFIINSN